MNGSVSNSNLPQLQRVIANQFKANCDLQAELLKCMQNYREAVENLAERSDKLSQTISKFALSSMEGFNHSKLHHPGVIVEHQQRQLFAALQQIVRFNTHISSELLAVGNTIQHEFDRPIQLNLEKFRSVSLNWERDFDREVRRIETDLKHKEADAAKAGKDTNRDMTKLSQSLQEISGMVAELRRVKQHRVEQAFYTDHKQYLFVAHHLQKVLKAEIQCHKAIYYHDRVKKNNNNGTSQPASQQQSSENTTTPARSANGGVVNELKQLMSQHAIPEPAPPARTAGAFIDMPGPGEPYDLQQEMPAVPRSAHRRTLLIAEQPSNSNLPFIDQAFSSGDNSGDNTAEITSEPPRIPEQFRKSVFVPAFKTMRAMNQANNSTDDFNYDNLGYVAAQHPEENGGGGGDEPTGGEETMDLALVIFDYPARAADDLNVLEGDIVRVISVEGEWMYGLLLQPAAGDTDEYVPSEINGVPQVGWLPVSFTTSIE